MDEAHQGQSCEDPELEEDEPFEMKRSTLLKQLRGILDNYPDNSQIIKELIQNAEDAGASEIRIFHDQREIESSDNNEYINYFKPPALCVYNNAKFTKEDWEGITTIYDSNKQEKPLKIGHYGLGFKSVFHITDTPVIVSGKKLLIIDPCKGSQECIPKSLRNIPKDTNLNNAIQFILKKFGFTQDCFMNRLYDGTLFWFPLRQHESKLSSNVYSWNKLQCLLHAFQEEASLSLLFLRNVKKIYMHKETADFENPSFSVDHKINANYYKEIRHFQETINGLRNNIPAENTICGFQSTMLTAQSEKPDETEKWVVSTLVKGTNSMTEKFVGLSKTLNYYPFVGIASKISLEKEPLLGHVFCFLPLPLQQESLTGLPVHVNGFFALGTNRGYVKWPSSEHEEDNNKEIQWNQRLCKEALVEAYLEIISMLKDITMEASLTSPENNLVYKALPDKSTVHCNWSEILDPLYSAVFDTNAFYTQNFGGKWIEISASIFSIFEWNPLDPTNRHEIEEVVLNVLTLCNENTVLIPRHLKDALLHYRPKCQKLSPEFVLKKLKSAEKYKQISKAEKIQLLEFLLSSEEMDFDGLELLPLNDGSFVSFNSTASTIYVCFERNDQLMFPILESKFANFELHHNSKTKIQKLATKGLCQLKVFEPSLFPMLLAETLQLNGCLVGEPFHTQVSSSLSLDWLQLVWSYLGKYFENLLEFEKLHILPLQSDSGLSLLRLKGMYMLKSYPGMKPLPEFVDEALSALTVTVIDRMPSKLTHVTLREHYCKLPSANNVPQLLQELHCSSLCLQDIIKHFNESCSFKAKKAFSTYLAEELTSDLSIVSKEILEKLNIFEESKNNNEDESLVSVAENKYIACKESFPFPFPKHYLVLDNKATDLAIQLGGVQLSWKDIVKESLLFILRGSENKHYTDEAVQRTFMEYFMQNISFFTNDSETLEVVKNTNFVTTLSGNKLKPVDVLNPDDESLKKLFAVYPDNFPHETFREKIMLNGLKHLGLRGISNISSSDLLELAEKIHNSSQTSDTKEMYESASMLLKTLQANSTLMQDPLISLCWVPCVTERPINYPKAMPWYGKTVSNRLCFPGAVCSLDFMNFGGTVSCFVDVDKMSQIAESFKWNKPPDIEIVIAQLKAVIDVYQNDEKIDLLGILQDIYEHFNKSDFSQLNELLKDVPFVFNNQGFCFPSDIVVGSLDDVDVLDMRPFIYRLPEEFYRFRDMFIALGCSKTIDLTHLINVLQKICQTHQDSEMEKPPSDLTRDRKLVISVLQKLIDIKPEEYDTSNILVPINTEMRLEMRPVKDCTYCTELQHEPNINEGKPEGMKVELYVHPDVPSSLAKSLHIQSLTKRFMNENNVSEITVQNWGQFEPITTRIANLLENYTDGFSVLKEIIQNAEDAGATVVRFMYDERTNDHLKTNVIGNMRECQGPAFWAFNDAEFQKEDFENIIKLGGRTKQTDRHKIGKFGLGFSSVYNLTDVPSFISGNTMVILDPHTSYLEEAISQKNNPGIRIDFTNPEFLRLYKDQFEVYNNIFDCMLSQENFPPNYQGTLFRFPLRTEAQAVTSDIKKLHYNKKEMISLLQKLESSIGDLLMFTQNLNKIELWHLGENATDPSLILTATKYVLQTIPSELEGRSVIGEAVNSIENVYTNQNKSVGFKIIQKIRIDMVMKPNDLMPDSKQEEYKSEANWLISWSTGKNDAVNKAMELKDKGALCIGGVSLPTHIDNDILSLGTFPLKDTRLGFYNQSHIFCFLPLPELCNLPVHINGCFAVEDDRKRIYQVTEDEKSTVDSKWNTTLLSDAVCDAYIHMLLFLNQNHQSAIFFNLWPERPISAMMENTNTHTLIQSFYSTIINEDPCLFSNNRITAPFSNCLFLESEIRHNETVGQIALDCLIEFHEGPEVVMDISEKLVLQFKLAGQEEHLKRRTLTVFDFFQNIVFPNIGDMKTQARDALVLYAMNEHECIHNLLKETNCIPTMPKGVLKKPRDLVKPASKIASLFSEEDGRFPRQTFNSEKVIDKLITLGMMSDTLPDTIILERAISIGNLQEARIKERCRSLLEYLQTVSVNDALISKIAHIPFLPILKKPLSWPLRWNGDTESVEYIKRGSINLGKPKHLFLEEAMTLIGSVQAIVDTSYMYWNCNKEEMLIKLGVVGKNEATFHDALKQLESLSDAGNEKLSVEHQKTMYTITHDLYEYLEHETQNQETKLDYLQNKPIIWMKGKLLCPGKVAFIEGYDEINCEPEIYWLSENMKRYSHLFEKVGIVQLRKQSILEIILKIQEANRDTTLNTRKIKLISNLLLLLRETVRSQKEILTEQEINDILIPDNLSILRHPGDLCIDDGYSLRDQDNVHFINENIPPVVYNMLDIKSKRCQHLYHIADSIPFGQKEELVTRIHGILKNSSYSSTCILNEMLQNSDDAGASEVYFILDKRQHSTDKIFSDSWADLQGPALCIYNDACFSDDDLKGIANLGIGSKYQNPTKTGQFGLGFNAVYHITDVPSLLTKGQTTPNEGAFCVFDPHCKYCPVAEKNNPGMKIPNLNSLQQNYPGVYNCYFQDVIQRSQGTWFRLPLRTPDMAEKSSLKCEPTSIEDVECLFQEFRLNMLNSLLFLRHVKKINISLVNENGCFEHIYEVQAEIRKDGNEELSSFFDKCDELSLSLQKNEISLDDVPFFEVDYKISLSDCENRNEKWIVVHTFGPTPEVNVSVELRETIMNGDIALSPRGGVALKIDGKICSYFNHLENEHYCAYSSLPLPIGTGLPLHINAHFALDPGRQHLREDWPFALWNKFLTENVIPSAYLKAIEKLRDHLFPWNKDIDIVQFDAIVHTYYASFPLMSKAETQTWKNMITSVFFIMLHRELKIFPVRRGTKISWVALKTTGRQYQAFFGDTPIQAMKSNRSVSDVVSKDCISEHLVKQRTYSDNRIQFRKKEKDQTTNSGTEMLSCILKDIGIKLIYIPNGMYKSIREALQSGKNSSYNATEIASLLQKVRKISARDVLKFISNEHTDAEDGCLIQMLGIHVEQTAMCNIHRVKTVLLYLIDEKEFFIKTLQHLPLLITNDGILRRFTDITPLYLSEFCDLFPESKPYFVHSDLVDVLQSIQADSKDILRELDLTAAVKFLHNSSYEKCLFDNDLAVWRKDLAGFPSSNWIESFWKYLDSLNIENADKVKLHLGNWCLVPGFDQEENHDILVSFNQCFTILDIFSFPGEERQNDVLKTWKTYVNLFSSLPVPRPLKELSSSSALKNLAASHKDPESVLKCLYAYRARLTTVESSAVKAVLMYLNEFLTLHEDNKEMLKALPLYETITAKCKRLNEDKTVRVLLENIPLPCTGIDEWADDSKYIILKDIQCLRKLFEFVGGKIVTLSEFYCKDFLPTFKNLKPECHIIHLTFIKDNLHFWKKDCGNLKDLHFVPNGDSLEKASFYYSPYVHLFQVMCTPSQFPPKPYNSIHWEMFMICAGMKDEITNSIYVNFAKAIYAQSKKEGISQGLEQKSKEMIKHIFKSKKPNYSLLHQIQEIPFIVPKNVLPSYNAIVSQYKRRSLMCFKGSVPSRFEPLVWSVMITLPEYADPSKALSSTESDKTQEITRNLAIKCIPPIQKIVLHIDKVCHSMKRSFKDSNTNKLENPIGVNLETLMSHFYEHLLQYGICEEAKTVLSQTPFVHVENKETREVFFVKPYRTVQNIHPSEEVQPYLCKIPYHYGCYCNLFIYYGATENPTLKQYSNVLERIFLEIGARYLLPKEIEKVKIAFNGIMKLLEQKTNADIDIDMKDVDILYLLENNKHQLRLMASTQLIIVDNKQLIKRLKHGKNLHFMAKMQKHEFQLIEKLPERLHPRFLSKVTKEKLLSSTDDRKNGDYITELLQTFLTSKHFLKGVNTIANKTQNIANTSDKINLEETMKMVNVHCLEHIITVLEYDGIHIIGSKQDVACFCTYENPNDLTIYLPRNSWNIRKFLKLTIEPISKFLCQVSSFQIEEQHMKDILDFIDDFKGLDEYVSILLDEDENEVEDDWLPRIGSFVPKVYHILLDSEFYELSVGEYVAYEIWDPLTESDAEDGDALYIYVKVLRKVVDTSSTQVTQDKYLVDRGSETDELVDAIKLYKFIRRPYSDCTEVVSYTRTDGYVTTPNKNSVYAKIRKTLTEAWNEDKRDRKTVIKRLLLRWHPDKNIGNETFCKEVTQYILYVISRLEKGEMVGDDIGSQSSSSRAPFTGEWSGFAERMFTSNRYYDQTWSGEGKSKAANPQPQEAKRWMRQAELDLRAAQITMESEVDAKVYNWVCVQCHQACEKALKAIGMKIDMDSVNRHSHQLTNIIIGMSVELDRSVERAISDLERLVGSYTRMRYPDTMQYPYIPGDVYTEEHASEALKLASQIVSNLAGKM